MTAINYRNNKLSSNVLSKVKRLFHSARVLASMLLFLLSAAVGAQEPIKQADDLPDFKFSGFLMVDFDRFDDGFAEPNDNDRQSTSIRRARLALDSQLHQDWSAKVQLSFEKNANDVQDLWLQYSGWQWATFTLGKQKESFGLEFLASSRNLMLIERSVASDSIVPQRSIGLNANGSIESVNWQLGYFGNNDKNLDNAVTGRVYWNPWLHEDKVLHLGFAFSERGKKVETYQLETPMEVFEASALVTSKAIPTRDISLKGLELIWIEDRFAVMGEWQQASVVDTSKAQSDYYGGYIQISYQLSGGHRIYKNGVLGGVKNEGWEMVGRFSQFTLENEDKAVDIYTLGMNFTTLNKLKFMANYLYADRAENNQNGIYGHAVSLRAQFVF